MPRKQEICVTSPEVAMHGEINIHARVAVVTKAKLDDIRIGGECLCGPAPVKPPTPVPDIYDPVALDLVILVDGSDSFNSTVKEAGMDSSQFEESMDWAGKLVNDVGARTNLATATVVQFSGFKNQDRKYVPGSRGVLLVDEGVTLRQFNFEHGPAVVTQDASLGGKLRTADPLDGNSQLFLALQDLALDSFKDELNAALPANDTPYRKRILVIVTDEEWDGKELAKSRQLSASIGDEEDLDAPVRRMSKINDHSLDMHQYAEFLPMLEKHVGPFYDQIHPCIVRRNHIADLEKDFISKHVAKPAKEAYHKIYEEKFTSGMEDAKKAILSNIDALIKPVLRN